jgi:F0F1-type ATP synthase membrane subunit b/b'
MNSVISTFHIDWKIIIAQAINFGVVFTVLYIFALKPLSKLMMDRTKKIEAGLNDAKKCNEMLQKATEEHKQQTIKLKQLEVNAKKELGKELEQIRIENLARLKADNDEWARQRTEQMEIDKKAIVESARAEVVSLAMVAVEKLIKSKPDLDKLL